MREELPVIVLFDGWNSLFRDRVVPWRIGMAEKVRDGVDGLHFRAGDAASLADVIGKAVTTPGLWEKLSRGIAPVKDIAKQVRVLEKLYDELLEGVTV